MTIEEQGANSTSDHLSDWRQDSSPCFSSFFDDLYSSSYINGYHLWEENQDLINTISSLGSPATIATVTSTTPPDFAVSDDSPQSDLSKKRKSPDEPVLVTSKTHQNPKRNHGLLADRAEDGDEVVEVEEIIAVRKSGGKKRSGKSAGSSCNNGGNREGRWAEQLLNPCAKAIKEGNLSRVQHLLYVLHELASPTGDANHRLAAHGLRSIAHHLSSTSSPPSSSVSPVTFVSAEPRFFQRSLIKFHEVSPWFTFPNNIANSAILQILSEERDCSRTLHILDIGVSHGVQWPILLEALTRRPAGPPPLVRLTVIAPPIGNDLNTETPFSIGPPGDNISSRLLCFAKSMNINLHIERLEKHLLSLDAHSIKNSPDETLIVCAQFRLHDLSHCLPDERTEFLRILRNMKPKGVILSDNNNGCSCTNCADFDTGFSRRFDYLWRFLDSTSAAFKGRESDERRLMEGEAAKALTNQKEMNEPKEKWCERMKKAGFVGEGFGDDAIDGAKALMKRYDSNWEMRVEEKDGCVCLRWKEQPVSFCSLWKLDMEAIANGSSSS